MSTKMFPACYTVLNVLYNLIPVICTYSIGGYHNVLLVHVGYESWHNLQRAMHAWWSNVNPAARPLPL